MTLDKQQITAILSRFDTWDTTRTELAEASGSIKTMPTDSQMQRSDDEALDMIADLAAAVRWLIPETPRTFVVQRGKKSGRIKHLICPYCQARDTLSEVDAGERWNELTICNDGTVISHIDGHADLNGTDEFVCQADIPGAGFCMKRSTAPEGFKLELHF